MTKNYDIIIEHSMFQERGLDEDNRQHQEMLNIDTIVQTTFNDKFSVASAPVKYYLFHASPKTNIFARLYQNKWKKPMDQNLHKALISYQTA